MPHLKKSFFALAICGIPFIGGCAAAQVAVEASREVARDVRLTKTRDYEKIKDSQKVALMVRQEGQGQQQFGFGGMGATGGSSAAVLGTRIEGILNHGGYEVIGQVDLEDVITDEESERPGERTIVKLARRADADVVIFGIIESGSAVKMGFFGVGSGQESGIVSASFKFVDAESRKKFGDSVR